MFDTGATIFRTVKRDLMSIRAIMEGLLEEDAYVRTHEQEIIQRYIDQAAAKKIPKKTVRGVKSVKRPAKRAGK